MTEDNPFITSQEVKELSEAKRNKLMYGDWLGATEEELNLKQIAEDYHSLCDAYDRHVCSGISPRTGEAMPVNGYELGIVNRHARYILNELVRDNPWFSMEQIRKAIKEHSNQKGQQI